MFSEIGRDFPQTKNLRFGKSASVLGSRTLGISHTKSTGYKHFDKLTVNKNAPRTNGA